MKTQPMKHQIEGLNKANGRRNFGFLAEQGTGKTWMALAHAERYYDAGKIDGILVAAPRGVHTNWVRREIPTHLSVPVQALAWKGKPTSKKAKAELESFMSPWPQTGKAPMKVFSINIDAFNTKDGLHWAQTFLESGRFMFIVDESTRIKNLTAKRTKAVIELGKLAIARLILSGTPMPKSPVDLFAQFEFLKPGGALLGTNSVRAFTAQYADLLTPDDQEYQAILRNLAGKSRGLPQVVRKDERGLPMFRNLDILATMIEPHVFRVKKEDCLDLPNKVYTPIYFDMTNKQRAIYEELENEYAYHYDDSETGTSEDMEFVPIAARTKMKQVTSGFINVYGDPELLAPEDNPRMEVFKDLTETIVDTSDDQFIVWAMFDEEIKQICDIMEKLGVNYAVYNGSTPQARREEIIDEFQAGKIRVFIGNPAAAGIGITLTAANKAIYYSCSYDNELRLQSEDRCHRIGSTGSIVEGREGRFVTYYDLICERTIDEDIVRSLSNKTKMAAQVIDRK